MIYALSNRQTKVLNTSRRPLLLYLPAPPEPPNDLVRWSTDRLPSVAGMIAEASLDVAICRPSVKQSDGPVGAFGFIVDEWEDDQHCFCIPVVAVMVRPQRVRGSVVGPQWPSGPMQLDATSTQNESLENDD